MVPRMGQEVAIVLEDEDAFILCCCLPQDLQVGEEAPMGTDLAERPRLADGIGIDEPEALAFDRAHRPNLTAHLTATVSTRPQAHDPNAIVGL